MCSVHNRQWEKGPLEFVLTRSARKALPWLMPCDVTDFVDWYPSVRHDKAFVIIIALLKEPRATTSFVEKALALAPAYGVDDLAAVLLQTLDDMRSPSEAHRQQLRALNQQGAGRFAGVAATCRAWGLIECVPAREAALAPTQGQEEQKAQAKEQEESVEGDMAKTLQGSHPRKRRKRIRAKSQPGEAWEGAQEEAELEDWWYLGLTGRAYRRTGAHERLGELLQASRDFRQPPEILDSTSFLEMVSWAEEFDKFLWLRSTTWGDQVGYVHDFLRRKLVLGQLSSSPARTQVQWSEVSVNCLKQMSPDVCGYLASAPAKWTAADLSRYCTDRDDWGVLVSMWACLWGAVVKAKAYQGHRDELIALVASDEFRDAAQDHVQRYGAAAHVLMLVQKFGPVDTWPEPADSMGSGKSRRAQR